MKKLISLLLCAVMLCCFIVPAAAYGDYSVATQTLNKILDEYRAALKNGESYVPLSSYGLSGADVSADLFVLFAHANADVASISFGKYSETYVTFTLDKSDSGAIKGVKLDYFDRYKKADGTCDLERVEEDRKIISERFNTAKSLAQRKMADAEKALVLYDFIISSASYAEPTGTDDDGNEIYPEDAYTTVGLLCDGSAVCAAYAKLYAILLNEAGIPAITVDSDTIDHEWVMAKIDGEWYHCDPTWDDWVFTNGYTALWDMNNDSSDIGSAVHGFFLKSDDEIKELEHPDWSVSYNVNPDNIDVVPESGRSGSFDDKFFSDKNETYSVYSTFSYINGNWYFCDLNSMKVIRATYDGDIEEISMPDGSLPKYSFGYKNDLYVCSDFFVYRYDTVGGKFDRIIEIPEDKRDSSDFSEMNVSFDTMTLITATYKFDENGDPTEAEYDVQTLDMKELENADPIIYENDESAVETASRGGDTAEEVTLVRPDKNSGTLSAEDRALMEMAETAGKRMMAFIYLGVAVVFIVFAVIAVVLAIKYTKKK